MVKISGRERSLLRVLAVLLVIWLSFEIVGEAYTAFLRVADVVIIFIVAWGLAYMLTPLVDAIDRRTPLNRIGAVGVVYAAIAVVLGATLAVAIPALVAQLDAIRERGPVLADNLRASVTGLQGTLDRAGIQVDLARTLGALPQRLGDVAGSIAADALGFVTATAAILFNLTLVLIIAFLMLLDGPQLWRRFTGALSEELRSEAELFRQSADRSFGGFIRGSLILGVFYGIATLAYLVPLGVPFAGVLSVVAGLAVIIPFFGPIIAMVPILVITLLGAPDRMLWVLILTALLQQVTLNIIGPRIIGTAVGIHPLFVFLALLLGSRIAGFWGVLLAMPIAGIIATFVQYGYQLSQGRRARTDAAALIEERDEAAEATKATERAAETRTATAK